uniref:Uncharacterized protein n=1 Tax=Siphoviridae sp. ctVif31 TaxID=2825532 RepID=A0A8S5Q4D9_9CAUD|nr:MAG TPA: hypothetical protein [Siphoviridae sp. ctVif31]
MERLTLEEAINHEKMMAQRKRWNGKFTKVSLGNEEINKRFEADCIKDAEEHEQFAEWLEELKLYKDIGTLKELKGLKENGTFTGLELAKLAIMQKELKKYEDLEEQGLLVRLPCKEAYSRSGDFVYLIYYYEIIECVHCGLGIDPLSGKAYITLATDEKLFPYRSPDPEQDLDPTDWCTNATDVEVSELGKTVFLTREEAEKKLEEMKKNGE